MPFRGHIKNGTVVFDEIVSIPDGTPVRIELLRRVISDKPKSRRIWKGIFQGQDPVPTEENISEVRNEIWPKS